MKKERIILIGSKLALPDQNKFILNWSPCEKEDINFQIQEFISMKDVDNDSFDRISQIIQKTTIWSWNNKNTLKSVDHE